MKVIVLKTGLATALALCGKAISTHTTVPILQNYCLEAINDQLIVTGTNRDMTIIVTIIADVMREGSITISAKLLAAMVGTLPEAEIELEVTGDRTKVSCDRQTANIKGLDADDYPLIVNNNNQDLLFSLPVNKLRTMISQVIFAASSDNSKPTLCAISAELKDNVIKFAATDGYRLAVRREVMDYYQDREYHLIIPGGAMRQVAAILTEAGEDDCSIQIDPVVNRISFQIRGRKSIVSLQLLSSLVDARFPDYTAIIPKTKNTIAIFDVKEAIRVFKTTKLFASGNANIIRLTCYPTSDPQASRITVASTDTNLGDHLGVYDTDVEGQQIEIAFNVDYMLQMLETFNAERAVLELTSPTRPGLLYPEHVDRSTHLCVVMPMHPPR